MKAIAIAGAMALCLVPSACETTAGGDLGTVLGGVLGGSTTQSGLTTAEIDAGLKQALTIGAERVAGQIGVTDGYFGDPQIKIPLPGRLGELQRQFDGVPFVSPLFNDLELRMNRAAESAVPVAKELVVDAVTSITLQDALGILQGGDTAATDFLRGRTETSLRQAFTPHVDQALSESGAFQALQSVTSAPGVSTVVGDYKNDLTTHAVNLGLNGLFFYVAEEEKRIRENPFARTTDLLRKVFGSR